MNLIYCHQEQMIPYALNLGQGRYLTCFVTILTFSQDPTIPPFTTVSTIRSSRLLIRLGREI
jgi:hypothetical protein